MRSCEIVPVTPKPSVIALWLRPAEPERESFRKIIGKLAETYDGPPFEPHLTLGGSRRIAGSFRSTRRRGHSARDGRYFFSSAFTKVLFVRFPSTPMLEELQNSLGLSGLFTIRISVCFTGICRRMRGSSWPVPSPCRFGRYLRREVCAVGCPNPTSTRAEVDSGRRLDSRKLARPGESNEGQRPGLKKIRSRTITPASTSELME